MRIARFIDNGGERHSTLVDATGLPDFWTTYWVVEKLRRAGQTSNTITSNLRAVQLLYRALPQAVDLTPRMLKGEWLTVDEADHLLRQMDLPAPQIIAYGVSINSPKESQSRSVVKLESMRSKLRTDKTDRVSTPTKELRLRFILDFLEWRAGYQIVRLRGEKKAALSAACSATERYIRSRTAHDKNSSARGAPKGLTAPQQAVLLDVIRPDSPRNPWKNDPFIRARNQLIVELLLACGPRRGAILGMYSRDLDPMTSRVSVLRRPDSPDDPRVEQTGNKRGNYLISLGHRVLKIFKTYQIHRHKVLLVKKCRTEYLIISSKGRPLEQSSVNYILRALRVIPELANIHPHLLRHTWASNYVEDAVARGVDFETIESELRTLGGWTKNSDMPGYYTRSYRQRAASESSMRLQAKSKPMTQKLPRGKAPHESRA